MIDVHLVVERQGVVAPAPVVADARPAIDDERVDAERLQARGDRKAGLPAADDEHLGISIGVGGGRLAQIEPIGT